MMEKLRRIWNIKDLRNSILFVLGMLVIFRAVAHVPIPGVNMIALRGFLEGNQILGLLNVFSGGTIENFSIAMLGVAPYITASIIFQLLVLVVPQLEEIQKEGEAGQRKISMYTRLSTVPLALLQAYGLIQLLSRTGNGIITDGGATNILMMTIIATAGTVFLMWIGELISEKNIGNGISLLIFAGIIAALPNAVQNAIVNYNSSDLPTYMIFLAVGLATVVGVVYISEGQRNIPLQYARQVRGARGYSSAQNHLPLRVNTAGVIPIIFAISVILFPPTIAQFFVASPGFAGEAAAFIISIFNNQIFYGTLYFVMVFGFTYFYTAVVFDPLKVAENLQRQGAYIPGIRPGTQTEEYVATTMNRLVFVGALFLGAIAVLPFIMQGLTGTQTLAIGGTSLLIVVSVAIDSAKKIEAQMALHEYDHL